jgi:hypothetical protein
VSTIMESEVSLSLKALEDVWYTKIPDIPRFGGDTFRANIPRPFDYVALCNGTFIGIECKQSQNPSSLPLGNISEHQVNALNEVEKCGGVGYMLVNVRLTKSSRRVNKMFAITPEWVDYWYSGKGGRKSIPVSWMEENCIEVKRVKLPDCGKYGWDLRILSPFRDSEFVREDGLTLF